MVVKTRSERRKQPPALAVECLANSALPRFPLPISLAYSEMKPNVLHIDNRKAKED